MSKTALKGHVVSFLIFIKKKQHTRRRTAGQYRGLGTLDFGLDGECNCKDKDNNLKQSRGDFQSSAM